MTAPVPASEHVALQHARAELVEIEPVIQEVSS